MKVHLSFDVEVWCNGWSSLDEHFPAAYERYVYGRSKAGDYALPKTLEILRRHGLTGVFFVEPLFSARFGRAYLRGITDLLLAAGQDVQLHLHPEWTDEIRPALLDDVSRKRQHLIAYGLDEQRRLIEFGKGEVEWAIERPVTAFRAGSYACNADTYAALAQVGIAADSSYNEVAEVSGAGMAAAGSGPFLAGPVAVFPVTVFQDGLGRLRPAQVGACGFGELRNALLDAQRAGQSHFVIVSHNFEMLRPGRSDPDGFVVRRFEALCAFLSSRPDLFDVSAYPTRLDVSPPTRRPAVGPLQTAVRYVEQALRRAG